MHKNGSLSSVRGRPTASERIIIQVAPFQFSIVGPRRETIISGRTKKPSDIAKPTVTKSPTKPRSKSSCGAKVWKDAARAPAVTSIGVWWRILGAGVRG